MVEHPNQEVHMTATSLDDVLVAFAQARGDLQLAQGNCQRLQNELDFAQRHEREKRALVLRLRSEVVSMMGKEGTDER